MREAAKGYLALAGSLTQVTRERATAAARALVAQGGATAEQVSSLVDDVLEQSRQNREAVTALVRSEVERALARLGLSSDDEVRALVERIRALETDVRRLTRAATQQQRPAGTAAAAKAAATRATATRGSAKKGPVMRDSADKAAPDKAVPDKAVPDKAVPDKAVPGKAAPGKAAAKDTPAKSSAKKAPAKKAPAKKSSAKDTPAKKTPAKRTPAKKPSTSDEAPARSQKKASTRSPARSRAT